jgi:hypothetical protein
MESSYPLSLTTLLITKLTLAGRSPSRLMK